MKRRKAGRPATRPKLQGVRIPKTQEGKILQIQVRERKQAQKRYQRAKQRSLKALKPKSVSYKPVPLKVSQTTLQPRKPKKVSKPARPARKVTSKVSSSAKTAYIQKKRERARQRSKAAYLNRLTDPEARRAFKMVSHLVSLDNKKGRKNLEATTSKTDPNWNLETVKAHINTHLKAIKDKGITTIIEGGGEIPDRFPGAIIANSEALEQLSTVEAFLRQVAQPNGQVSEFYADKKQKVFVINEILKGRLIAGDIPTRNALAEAEGRDPEDDDDDHGS